MTEDLNTLFAPYVGGELEIQNPQTNRTTRGKIARIDIIDAAGNEDDIVITLEWNAVAMVKPNKNATPVPSLYPAEGWEQITELTYRHYSSLPSYIPNLPAVPNIHRLNNKLLMVRPPHETAILYPKDSDAKMDLDRIKWLPKDKTGE